MRRLVLTALVLLAAPSLAWGQAAGRLCEATFDLKEEQCGFGAVGNGLVLVNDCLTEACTAGGGTADVVLLCEGATCVPAINDTAGTQVSDSITFPTNGDSLNNGTDDTFDFTRDDTGTVTITASDDDATAALTVVPGGAAALTLGGASTTSVAVTTDGASLGLDTVSNTLTVTASSTNTAIIAGADASGAANLLIDTATTGTITIGTADVASLTVTTDGTTDGDVVLPNDSIGIAELTRPAHASVNICGDAVTIAANTVYYGPSLTLLANTVNGMTCDINAAGDVTEGNVDEALFIGAVGVAGMTCRNEGDAGFDVSYTLRTAAGATVPSVTCTILDNNRSCTAAISTTTDIGAGALISLAVASTGDVGANTGFVCEVDVVF